MFGILFDKFIMFVFFFNRKQDQRRTICKTQGAICEMRCIDTCKMQMSRDHLNTGNWFGGVLMIQHARVFQQTVACRFFLVLKISVHLSEKGIWHVMRLVLF